MYRTGHVGIALLVYAPIGATLLGTGRAELAVLGGACMIALASLPDVDHSVPFVRHRGGTHTVGFALLVGGTLGATGWVVSGHAGTPSASALAVFGFQIGTLAVCAHLLGDLLTPAGIAPFWPLWERRFSLDLVDANDLFANYGLLVCGVLVTAAIVGDPTTAA